MNGKISGMGGRLLSALGWLDEPVRLCLKRAPNGHGKEPSMKMKFAMPVPPPPITPFEGGLRKSY